MHLEIRALAPSELPLLLTAEPFRSLGGIPFNMDHVLPIVGLDAEQRVRAYWFILDAVHVEPLWIDEEYRGNPGIARALWRQVRTSMQSLNIAGAYGIVKPADAAYNIPLALRLGFKKVEGQLLFIPVSQEAKEMAKRPGFGVGVVQQEEVV